MCQHSVGRKWTALAKSRKIKSKVITISLKKFALRTHFHITISQESCSLYAFLHYYLSQEVCSSYAFPHSQLMRPYSLEENLKSNETKKKVKLSI